MCKHCTFLRAFSEHADQIPALERCPACGGEMIAQRQSGRFQSAYVAKVSLDLHSAPVLDREQATS